MRRKFSGQSGMTLVESLMAIVILLVGLLAMAQALTFSVLASKTHGRDATKATASANDKMQELTGLQFNDTTTDITVNPPYPATGTGLTAGGSIPPAAPLAGYADYLDASGARTTAGDAVFTRQWRIADDPSGAPLKTISVCATSNRSFQVGTPPSTTIVTEKVP
ncbi:MAG: prepilin-type N-terminal cleavage/methylation domain-containing protein [Acidobacteria bacterium]|nr:prepilin-type N-terminal cleavage/methylation domain-containing protein [Acidobacteriota bacterium]